MYNKELEVWEEAWEGVPDGALFWDGNECTSLTGGWTSEGYGNTDWNNHGGSNYGGYVQNGEIVLRGVSGWSYSIFGTNNPINLSQYNTIHLTVTNNSKIGLYYCSSKLISNSGYWISIQSPLPLGEQSYSISNVSSSVYIIFECNDGGGGKVSRIWLE